MSCEDLLSEALREAAEACEEVGVTLTFILRGEGDVTRGGYESITDLSTDQALKRKVCAMNVQWSPSQRRREAAGLSEEHSVIVWTPAWDDIDFLDIDITRTEVEMGNQTFSIEEKGRANVIAGTPLYYTFGLKEHRR